MKRLLQFSFLFAFILFSVPTQAQDITYVDGAIIHVKDGQSVTFFGGLEGTGSTATITNEGAITIKEGVVLTSSALLDNDKDLTIEGGLAVNKSSTVDNSSKLTIKDGIFIEEQGNIKTSGSIEVDSVISLTNQGKLDVESGGSVTADAPLRGVVSTDRGELSNNGTFTLDKGSVSLDKSTFVNQDVFKVEEGDFEVKNTSSIRNTNTVEVTNGSATLSGSQWDNETSDGLLNVKNNKLEINQNMKLTNKTDANISVSGGNLIVSDNGTILDNQANVTVSLVTDTLLIGEDATVTNSNKIEVFGFLVSAKAKEISNNTTNSSLKVDKGFFLEDKSPITNEGTITVGDSSALDTEASFTNKKDGVVKFGSSLTIAGKSKFDNFDTLSILTNNLVVNTGGELTNNNDGILNIVSGSILGEDTDSKITNEGFAEVNVNVDINDNFTLTNSGQFLSNTGTLIMSKDASLKNDSIFSVSNGGAQLSQTAIVTNENRMLINGNVTLESTSNISNSTDKSVLEIRGETNLSSNSLLNNAESSSITADKLVTVDNATFINKGSVEATEGVAVINGGNLTNEKGEIEVLSKGISLQASDALNKSIIDIQGSDGLEIGANSTYSNQGSLLVAGKLNKFDAASSVFTSQSGSIVEFQGSDDVIVSNIYEYENVNVKANAILDTNEINVINGELIITDGALLTSSPGLKIRVKGDYDAQNGSLVLKADQNNISELLAESDLLGGLTIQRYIGQRSGERWFGSPVETNFSDIVEDGTYRPENVLEWRAESGEFRFVTNQSAVIPQGVGYALKVGQIGSVISLLNTPGTIEVKGSSKNDNVNISLEYNNGVFSSYFPAEIKGSAREGWNFIANPYPATLDWNKITKPNDAVDAALYQIKDDGRVSTYKNGIFTNDASPFIPPGHGFKMRAKKAGAFQIPSDARDFFTGEEAPEQPQNLALARVRFGELDASGNEISTDEILLAITLSSDEEAIDYSAVKHFNDDNIHNVYFANDSASLAIRKETGRFNSYPLGFKIPNSSKIQTRYKISAEITNFETTWTLNINDNKTRGNFNLLEQDVSHEFEADNDFLQGDNERFTLLFNQDNSIIGVTEDAYAFVNDEGINTVFLKEDSDGADVTFYNSAGRVIHIATNVEGNTHTFKPNVVRNVNKQVYIIKVDIDGDTTTLKVIY